VFFTVFVTEKVTGMVTHGHGVSRYVVRG